VTAFFIPGTSSDANVLEGAYGAMRKQIEVEMGRRPSARRILSVWTRRGSLDCVTEVGLRDPLNGGTVMAIFDMGPHQPFVVWCQQDDQNREAVRDVLRCNAYSVMEFDS
jgi:hypothetical protein